MEGILFFDIETVASMSRNERLQEVPESFIKRFEKDIGVNDPSYHYSQTAALFAEWGKICSVSIATLHKGNFIIKTLASRFEKDILKAIANSFSMGATQLAGHNIKEFDCPYLYRRFMANGMACPALLNVTGKKTWDYPFIDTIEIWSGSQWKHKVSLSTLAEVLGVPSPKSDMDGSKIDSVFYGWPGGIKEGDLPFSSEEEAMAAIAKYNAGDVLCSARVYAKLKGLRDISDSIVSYLPLSVGKE